MLIDMHGMIHAHNFGRTLRRNVFRGKNSKFLFVFLVLKQRICGPTHRVCEKIQFVDAKIV